ncbi:winged helix-turn-helix transcriptional regulator [Mycolicibacterium nivoides]|uniref:Winged helix-turn-helix transcriptional regulator n=2 Tax=Mycolicibacterium nivoides TaxID=2487344 RepID=A0ABW9L693_9MYCO
MPRVRPRSSGVDRAHFSNSSGGVMVERGILDREVAASGRRQVYTLTQAGRDLFTVVVALRQWGERHAFEADEARSVLVDERGLALAELRPTDSRGAPADPDSTSVRKDY